MINEDILNSLLDLSIRSSPKNEYVLYTGERGAAVFHFHMVYGDSFYGKWWNPTFKHTNVGTVFISVVRKHSLYKVRVTKRLDENYKFTLYKGTKMISYFTNIKALNEKLVGLHKEADLEDVEREHVRQIKKALRIREGKLALIEKEYGSK